MKNNIYSFLIIVFSFFSFSISAQNIVVKSANLVISNGIDLELDNVEIKGNASNSGNIINNGTITISSNWTTEANATFSFTNSGEVKFIGNDMQEITSNGSTFGNITINNTCTSDTSILLLDNLNLNNNSTIDLINGIINTGSFVADLGNNPTISNASVNSFIDGKIKIGSGTDVNYPTGDIGVVDESNNAFYSPVTITTSQATEIEYIYDLLPDYNNENSNIESGLINLSLNEYWKINTLGTFGEVSFSYSNNPTPAAEEWDHHGFISPGETFTNNGIVISAYNPGAGEWSNLGQGGFVGDLNDGTFTSDLNIPDNSTLMTYASTKSSITLPITLGDFYAICNNNYVEIYWTTLNEINNDFFIVEKSTNGVNFYEIAQILGEGNSNSLNEYSFTDYDFSPVSYYRMKQVDFDGTITTFNTISVNCNETSNFGAIFNLYPNPSKGIINITGENIEQNLTYIEVVDMLGRTIYTEEYKHEQNRFYKVLDLSHICPSTYLVNIINANTKKVFKVDINL